MLYQSKDQPPCYDQPRLSNLPETHLEGLSNYFAWAPTFIDFDASSGWDKKAFRRPGHFELTRGETTLHFKQPDGPREPATEVALSFFANQLAIPAALTGFALLDGNWGTVSLVTYTEAAHSARQIVDQQGLRTSTNFTVFSALTSSWDWKDDHYVTNGVFGQWIDWSHSLGGPVGLQTPPGILWATPYDAPLGALTGQQWPLLWNAVHRIETFPITGVLSAAADAFATVLPTDRYVQVKHHFEDVANFLEIQRPLLRHWIGSSQAESDAES